MEKSLAFVKTVNQLPMNLKKQAVDYLAYACREILENKIKLAYKINRDKPRSSSNFVSLENMLAAVRVQSTYSPVSITVFIDEDRILWEDRFRKPIVNDEELTNGFSFSYQDSIAGGSENSFKQDIVKDGEQNKWVLEESLKEIDLFIAKDFKFYLNNKILRK